MLTIVALLGLLALVGVLLRTSGALGRKLLRAFASLLRSTAPPSPQPVAHLVLPLTPPAVLQPPGSDSSPVTVVKSA
jgi:hypothetical protein